MITSEGECNRARQRGKCDGVLSLESTTGRAWPVSRRHACRLLREQPPRMTTLRDVGHRRHCYCVCTSEWMKSMTTMAACNVQPEARRDGMHGQAAALEPIVRPGKWRGMREERGTSIKEGSTRAEMNQRRKQERDCREGDAGRVPWVGKSKRAVKKKNWEIWQDHFPSLNFPSPPPPVTPTFLPCQVDPLRKILVYYLAK